ncbi:MAG: AAA family ATPase [Aeromonas sp.]
MSKRIAFFNHKGGVSKTTTTFNLGWKLAEGARVLLVDGDPQCNLTSLVIDDFDAHYSDDATKHNNLRDGVEPAFKGRPSPISAIDAYISPRNANLHLIPGHQNLHEFEAALNLAQAVNTLSTLENLPGAFNAFIREVEEKYQIDYTIIDLNPGLSAINQNLVLASDYLLIPTSPDPFSLMALETLKVMLPRWANWLIQNGPQFNDSSYPFSKTPPKLLGAVIQRFNVRKGKAAQPYRDNINDIKTCIKDELMPVLSASGMALPMALYGQDLIDNGLCLSEIPNFQGLLPKAIQAGVPVFTLTDAEINETGTVLDQMIANRDIFNEIFTNLANEVRRLTV